jgi:putative endonuclease
MHQHSIPLSRRSEGSLAHHAGLAAEDSVAMIYERAGHRVLARRWRGKSGEIDLIVQDADGFIFVEVKQSNSHAQAASHVSRSQIQRLFAAASEYVAAAPKGQLSDMRFDVALVDGTGQIDILENALAA